MSYLGRSAKLSLKAQEKVSFLATAGQTVKTGLSYTPSFIEVYVNGVLLTDTTDFTATNGNSITFTVALLLNDEVTVISLKTFTVADHYSKTEADTLLAAKSPLASPSFTGTVSADGLVVNDTSGVSVSHGYSLLADVARVGSGSMQLGNVASYSCLLDYHDGGVTTATLRNTYGSTAASAILALDSGLITFNTGTSFTERMRIDAAGIVTKPYQPAFQARTAQVANLPINQSYPVPYGIEVFDQNSDFNPSTYIFTAPVTGKYQLNAHIYLNNVVVASGYVELFLITSNKTYYSIISVNGFDTDLLYFTIPHTVLADMDAGDTAKVNLWIASGSQTADLQAETYFSGSLIC
jgi:hypothetical protein